MTILEFQGTYRPLSNFWFLKQGVRLLDDSFVYPTVEHAYQAAKSLDMNDRKAIAERIESPGAAKKYGRTIKIRPDWDSMKRSIMLRLLRQKFFNNADLRQLLISTGDQHLEEGNYWHDNYWGVCYCNVCNNDRNIESYNWLGQLLMHVRLELQINAYNHTT